VNLKVGDIIRFERMFTKEDVEMFTKVSWDEGDHHIHPDEQGRLVIQGLLTATLPTKIGGEHNVLARTMNFEFLRPVFTGDTILCEVQIEKLEPNDNNRTSILATFLCTNQNEKQVLRGSFAGVILSN
jgi:3-hydroxybutyryl-CoA dehydratase